MDTDIDQPIADHGSRRRLLLGALGIAAATVIGSAGVAAAATDDSAMPGRVTACQTGFADLGFKTTGDCVSWWATHHTGHGYGYGGALRHRHHHHTFWWWAWLQQHGPWHKKG